MKVVCDRSPRVTQGSIGLWVEMTGLLAPEHQ